MELSILLTGFVPFDGDDVNPSGDCAKALHDKTVTALIGGQAVVGRIAGVGDVPVVFHSASPTDVDTGAGRVASEIEKRQPDIVISMGVAPGSAFRVERVAHNIVRAHSVDNTLREYAPTNETKTPDGEGFYHHGTDLITLQTHLPIEACEAAIEGEHGTVVKSEDPGEFVCEDVMFEVLSEVKEPRGGHRILRGGFIHVPRQGAQDLINRCILAAVQATVASLSVGEIQGDARGARFLPTEQPGARF